MRITKPYKKAKASHITSFFRTDSRPNHDGIDMAYRYGTPLVAPFDCTVKKIEQPHEPEDLTIEDKDHTHSIKRGYGIRLQHESGLEVLYWHCTGQFPVNEGDTLKKGQIVSYMGNTGMVYRHGRYVPLEDRLIGGKDKGYPGTHVHLEVVKNGEQVNPLLYIDWREKIVYPKGEWSRAFNATILFIRNLFNV